MATKKATETKKLDDELRDSAHRVWLAGLGALSTVEEQGSKLFQQLVDKGRDLESEGKERMKKARERVESEVDRTAKKVKSRVGDLGESLEDKMTDVLHRFGVPTRDEIRDLTKRVEELNSKVDKLRTGSAAKPAKSAKKAPAASKG